MALQNFLFQFLTLFPWLEFWSQISITNLIQNGISLFHYFHKFRSKKLCYNFFNHSVSQILQLWTDLDEILINCINKIRHICIIHCIQSSRLWRKVGQIKQNFCQSSQYGGYLPTLNIFFTVSFLFYVLNFT